MPLTIPEGFGLAAFVLEGAQGDGPFVTTLGLDISAHGGDYVAAANNAFQAYASEVMPITSSALELVRCNLAVNGGFGVGGGSVDSSATAVTGGGSGLDSVLAMAPIVRKVTNLIGRVGRGRMFLPGVLNDSDVNESGDIGSARLTALDNAMVGFQVRLEAPVTGTPIPPFLLHSNPVVPPTAIESFQTSPIIGWIRGRIR